MRASSTLQMTQRWSDAVSAVCLASMLLSSAVRAQAQPLFAATPVLIPAVFLMANMTPGPSSSVRFPNSSSDEKRRRYAQTGGPTEPTKRMNSYDHDRG